MIRALWQQYRIRRLIIILGIIMFIILFKLAIDYMNYSFSKTFIFENEDGYPYDFMNSEFSDEYTEIYVKNEKIYIACLKNIKYLIYPSFFKRNDPAIKYSLDDALQKKFTTLEELENYYDNIFSDFPDLSIFKTKDLIIYNNEFKKRYS